MKYIYVYKPIGILKLLYVQYNGFEQKADPT